MMFSLATLNWEESTKENKIFLKIVRKNRDLRSHIIKVMMIHNKCKQKTTQIIKSLML